MQFHARSNDKNTFIMCHIVQFHARSNDKNTFKNMFLHVYVLNTRNALTDLKEQK